MIWAGFPQQPAGRKAQILASHVGTCSCQYRVQISRTDDSNAVDLTAENGRADSKARESIISGPLMALRYLLDVGGLSSGHPHPAWWTWVNTPTTPTPWLQSCQFDVGRQEGLAGSAEVGSSVKIPGGLASRCTRGVTP
ncbi:hypothetical protein PGT21_020148 [Puccinia graminis f. sp. tritici]|uniref:Uncharacterized protein n=1 Tax=Puccinia graminis f. sp. tritici TaxID=56615 RepID=A0A5B0LL09_PUCGR|nr:hypothetical protein PGT21_020148 [Puccinia graminis f. sp. tritici]